MQKKFIRLAAAFAALAVGMGAFGAHALKALLTEYQLDIYKTAVQYQFFHVFALFIVALLIDRFAHPLLARAGWFFVAGILLFSGSLYLLACRDILGIGPANWLGPLTPIGGLCFIIGWLLVLAAMIKSAHPEA